MEEANVRSNFIWDFIDEDLKEGRYTEVHTRFPPESVDYGLPDRGEIRRKVQPAL